MTDRVRLFVEPPPSLLILIKALRNLVITSDGLGEDSVKKPFAFGKATLVTQTHIYIHSAVDLPQIGKIRE